MTSEISGNKASAAPQANRLMLFFAENMKLLQEAPIIIRALTDEGTVDPTRDDVVEVSINQESRTAFKNGEKTLRIQLTNGEVSADIKTGTAMETVIFRASWISGKSPLQNVLTNILVGGLLI